MKILWDLDGTILDTYPTLVESFIKVAGRGLDPTEVLFYMKQNSKIAFAHYGISEELREEFQRIDSSLPIEDKPPFPDVEEVLKLASINVMVTHRNREATLELLKHFKLLSYFTEVVCPEDDGYLRKPDKESYQYLHDKYRIDLVIGDRELDFKPARELGIKTCCFQNPSVEADFHLNNYKDFEKVVIQKGSGLE